MDNFQSIANQLDASVTAIKANMPFVLCILAGLYVIQIVNFVLGYRLNILGIYPRRLLGLPGIVFAPFLHGNFNHLFFNSIPLFMLLCLMLLGGITTFYLASAIIIVLCGLATWLFGRPGIHVGASGVIMGYWAYVLFNAYHQGSVVAIASGAICIYYLGSLLLNLFPLEAKSSWESHVFGFLAGIAASYIIPYMHGMMLLKSTVIF
jgi:membrane associated rhomboid family serine protease